MHAGQCARVLGVPISEYIRLLSEEVVRLNKVQWGTAKRSSAVDRIARMAGAPRTIAEPTTNPAVAATAPTAADPEASRR